MLIPAGPPGGFVDPWDPASDEQNRLVMKIAAAIAARLEGGDLAL